MATIQITHFDQLGLFVTTTRRNSELLVHHPMSFQFMYYHDVQGRSSQHCLLLLLTDHVWVYRSKVAEGISAFNVGLVVVQAYGKTVHK